jgi:DNA-binding GntR family transcriptional regulator
MAKKSAPATLALQAYDRIRNKILGGEYPLGDPLSRRKLAEELGMSLIPVTEALQRLETEGLVESKPRVGTRVRIPTIEDIRGHYVVREALESQSARLFVQLANKEDKRDMREMAELVDKLSGAIGKVDDAHRADASFEFERTHLRFHARIAECSSCPALVEAIERSRVLIYSWLFSVTVDAELLPGAWHRDLVRTLLEGDVLAADAAMRRHVTYRQERILRKFEVLEQTGHFESRFVRGPQRRVLTVA